MVGGSDSVGKKGIASEEVWLGVKTDGTGRVARRGDNFNNFVSELDFFG